MDKMEWAYYGFEQVNSVFYSHFFFYCILGSLLLLLISWVVLAELTGAMLSSQEALHREQMLEQKLATLQRLLAVTQEASDTSWQVCAGILSLWTELCTAIEILAVNEGEKQQK